jgi:hypothetical protein
MATEKTAILTIGSEGNIPVYRVRAFLNDIEHAYSYIYVANMLLSHAVGSDYWQEANIDERVRRYARWVPVQERLILRSVELHSPGDWSFLGNLIPLETIRRYLQDRHERQKDRNYREAAEERKLKLQNDLREAKLLRDQLDNARKMGATDKDLMPLLDRLVIAPLRRLDRFQDEGVAREISISESEDEREKPREEQRQLPTSGKRKIEL